MTLSLRRSDREGAWLRTPRPTCLLAALALASLLGPAAAPAADIRVEVTNAQVDLDATAAPVAEVLDRLARQTGMKLVYDGPKPRALVTLKLRGRTPAETVLAVLEGLGVNFALVAEPTGGGAQTLMVSSVGGPTAATPEPRRAAAPARLPFLPASADDPPLQDDQDGVEDLALPSSAPEPQATSPPSGPDGTAAPPAAEPAPGPSVSTPPQPQQQYPVSPFAPQAGGPTAPALPFPLKPPVPLPGSAPAGDNTSGTNTKPDSGQAPPP